MLYELEVGKEIFGVRCCVEQVDDQFVRGNMGVLSQVENSPLRVVNLMRFSESLWIYQLTQEEKRGSHPMQVRQ